MKIESTVAAGTLESSDIMITLSPNTSPDGGFDIKLESPVRMIYGDAIVKKIRETLISFGVTDAVVFAKDSGATDPVIAARVETAVKRAAKKQADK